MRKLSLRRRPSSLPQIHTSRLVERRSPKITPQVKLHRRLKVQSLVRTKSGAIGDSGEELYAQTPILDLVTPLGDICHGWTQAEIQAGRRLVRFGKVQDGRRLIVSCEPISQEEYCEQDSVISCIYQEETDTCFVTSVDVIYLLERLTNSEFPVEEKNRIRRNLEGLRPTTVSKHKVGYGEFFQRIMEFPDPKPRNIEKDLKVFKWNLLGQALEKILSKYVGLVFSSSLYKLNGKSQYMRQSHQILFHQIRRCQEYQIPQRPMAYHIHSQKASSTPLAKETPLIR